MGKKTPGELEVGNEVTRQPHTLNTSETVPSAKSNASFEVPVRLFESPKSGDTLKKREKGSFGHFLPPRQSQHEAAVKPN